MIAISVRTASKEIFKELKRKHCAARFSAIPGFVAVLKIPVV